MKKKFSKRLLSLFLAAMMVVTSIPFAAMSALADTSVTVASKSVVAEWDFSQVTYNDVDGYADYFTNASDQNLYAYTEWTTGITYSATGGGSYFIGNSALYFDVNNSDISGGFRYTVVANIESEANTDNSSNYGVFGIGTTGSSGGYNDLVGFDANGILTVNGSEVSTSASVSFPNTDFVTYVVNYYDGTLTVTVDDTVLYTAEVTLSGAAHFRAIDDDSSYYATGYVQDIKLESYTSQSMSDSDIISAYETKMSDGNLYYNMPEAYTAYCDVYEYINDSNTDDAGYSDALVALYEATQDMTEWTAPTGTTDVYHKPSGLDGSVAEGYYNNVLYTDNVTEFYGSSSSAYTETSATQGFTTYKVSWKIVANLNYALLYDSVSSSDTYIPVVLEAKGSTTTNSRSSIYYVALDEGTTYNDYFSLDSYWYGYGTDYTVWPGMTSSNYSQTISSIIDSSTSNDHTQPGTSSYFYDNKLTVNVTFDDSTYYKQLCDSDTGLVYELYAYLYSSGNAKTGTTTIPQDIYVVDYSKLHTVILAHANLDNSLYDVSEYTQGGLATYLSNLDIALNYDPNDAFSSTDASTLLTDTRSCATAIESLVTQLNSLTPGTTDEFDTDFTVDTSSKDTTRDKYLFAYFTGQDSDDGELIRFAVSDDGTNYEALNGNSPVLSNTPSVNYYYTSDGVSTDGNSYGIAASGYARDPYILQKHDPDTGEIIDGYYVMATDLKVDGDNYRNTKLLFWDVEDLTTADEVSPWSVETTSWFSGVTPSTSGDYEAWAPEAIWDSSYTKLASGGAYMLYWSTGMDSTDGYYDIKLHYCYTLDFINFYDSDGNQLGVSEDASASILLSGTSFATSGSSYMNIDGDIVYDGTYYWLFFKAENEGQIYYCHALNASGPYSTPVKFQDNDFKSGCEGVEVYQLNDGTWIMMYDYYSSSYGGQYYMYSGSTLNSIGTHPITSNINHLSPRHGGVCYITTDEYNALAEEYGKATYDGTGLTDGSTADDNLIARYFTNSDVTYDATGNGYTLTVSETTGLTMTIDDGYTCAYFDNSSGTTSTNYGDDGTSYATISTTQMYYDYLLNAQDGVTFDWYGKSDNGTDYASYFNIGNISESVIPGSQSGDGSTLTGYIYYSTSGAYGAAGTTCSNFVEDDDGEWHHYTVTVTESFYNLYVDGVLIRTEYKKGTPYTNGTEGVNLGTPLLISNITDSWFTSLFKNGQLNLGVSLWGSDPLLNGYISDFKIYKKALSQKDISQTSDASSSDDYGSEVTDDAVSEDRLFYDPMNNKEDEDLSTESETVYKYTSYNGTMEDETAYSFYKRDDDNGTYYKNDAGEYQLIDDDYDGAKYTLYTTVGVQGEVLNGAGGQLTHNGGTYSSGTRTDETYYLGSGTTASNGYTVSLWYNPGASIDDSTTIFNIGTVFGEDSNNKQTFELTEDGQFHYNWKVDGTSHYIDVTDAFGESSLSVNDWTFITIQIIPSSQYDVVNVYFNGELVQSIDTFNNSYGKGNLDVSGYSIHDYFAANRTVYYATSCGNWTTNTNDCYFDDFSIYQGIYSASSLFAYDSQENADTLIYYAMYLYNSMMSALDGADHVYTNMYDAYVAYDRCVRYLDTIAYDSDGNEVMGETGHVATLEEYVELYTDLMSAINNMDEYKEPTTVEGENAADSSVSNEVDAKYTNNLMTTIDLSNVWEYTETTDDYNQAFSSTGFTWLYTGFDDDTPTAPMSAYVYAKASNSDKITGMYLTDTSEVSFGGLSYGTNDPYWHFTTQTSPNWYYESSVVTGYPTNVKQTSSYSYSSALNTGGGYSYGSNYLSYVGGSDGFTSASEDGTYDDVTCYYKTINLAFGFTYYWKSTFSSGYTSSATSSAGDHGTTYVINYVPVYEALTSAEHLEILANTTDYSPDDLATFLQAYDALTSLDYVLNSSMDTVSFAKTLKGLVDDLNGITVSDDFTLADTEDLKASVSEYASYLTDLEVTYGDDESGEITTASYSQNYTYSAYKAFYDAYETIVNYQLAHNPFEQNVLYTTNQDEVDALVDTVKAALAALLEEGDELTVDGITGTGTGLAASDYTVYDEVQRLATVADLSAYNSTGSSAILYDEGYGTKEYALDYDTYYDTYTEDYAGYIAVDSSIIDTYTGKTSSNTGTVNVQDATQSEVDAMITDMLTDFNENRNTYHFTLNVYVDGTLNSDESYENKLCEYGDVVSYSDVIDWASSNSYDISYITSQTSGSSSANIVNLDAANYQYSNIIQSDSTVEIYLVSKDDSKTRVELQNYFGRQIGVAYIDSADVDSLDGLTSNPITLNSTDFAVDEYYGYTFTKWSLSENDEDGGYILIQKGSYSAGSSTLTVYANGPDSSATTMTKTVNTKVTLSTDLSEFYAWIKTDDNTHYYVASYESSFSTFVPSTNGITFIAVTETQFANYDISSDIYTNKLPTSFGTAATTLDGTSSGKCRLYCDFSVLASSSNVEIVEAGVVASRSTTPTYADFTKGETGISTLRANSITDYNTYTITVSAGDCYMRSYVSYIYTTTLTSSDGETTYDVNVPRVAYGPIVYFDSSGSLSNALTDSVSAVTVYY